MLEEEERNHKHLCCKRSYHLISILVVRQYVVKPSKCICIDTR